MSDREEWGMGGGCRGTGGGRGGAVEGRGVLGSRCGGKLDA